MTLKPNRSEGFSRTRSDDDASYSKTKRPVVAVALSQRATKPVAAGVTVTVPFEAKETAMLLPPKFIFSGSIPLASVTSEPVNLVVLLFKPKEDALAALPDTTVSGVTAMIAPDRTPPPNI